MPTKPLVIRPTIITDIAAITAIFAPEVEHGTASWAYDAPSLQSMYDKYQRLIDDNFPWFTATVDDQVVGFCFGSAYRPREGYRFLVENSIYVATGFRGQGIARQLMNTLIDECTKAGFRQMIAVIGDSNNEASIELHRLLGFTQVGLLPNIGYKFDRWLDSVVMQLALGDGHTSHPDSEPGSIDR